MNSSAEYIKHSKSCCDGWDVPAGHPVKDGSVVYRVEADLWLCKGCYEEFMKDKNEKQ